MKLEELPVWFLVFLVVILVWVGVRLFNHVRNIDAKKEEEQGKVNQQQLMLNQRVFDSHAELSKSVALMNQRLERNENDVRDLRREIRDIRRQP